MLLLLPLLLLLIAGFRDGLTALCAKKAEGRQLMTGPCPAAAAAAARAAADVICTQKLALLGLAFGLSDSTLLLLLKAGLRQGLMKLPGAERSPATAAREIPLLRELDLLSTMPESVKAASTVCGCASGTVLAQSKYVWRCCRT
jgi:hypothetical protein